MNIIPKKIWRESLGYSTPYSILFLFLVMLTSGLKAQNRYFSISETDLRFLPAQSEWTISSDTTEKISYPNPKKVFHRSLLVPGWGQITNRQAWKVPIVYGLIGGLTYYSIYLTTQYHDYQAAYFNLVKDDPNDFRFGPTPDYLLDSNNSSALKSNRDFLRNRRDFVYVTIGLAWLLNGVDAYVYAHLRSFDVSDDLSLNGTVRPTSITSPLVGKVPSISLTFNLTRK